MDRSSLGGGAVVSQSIVCVYCTKPLLDAAHAYKHVEKCTESPSFRLRKERDEAIKLVRELCEQRFLGGSDAARAFLERFPEVK